MDSEKSTKEVLGDYLKEIIGYDNGLWRTLVDLRKNPDIVLKGYLEKDHKYVSPFRFLISGLSLWVLVNSFFLDWYTAFKSLMYSMAGWIQRMVTIPEKNQKKFEHYIQESANLYAKLVGDLFTKYYVPLVLIALPLAAFLASKKCKKYNVSFKTLLAAMSYSASMNVFLMFAISWIAYYSVFFAFIIVGVPFLVLQLTGRGDLIFILPIRKFFISNGVDVEKQITKSILFSTLMILLPGMIYFYYYVFYVLLNAPN
ncbi:MAG TPA: hypothetical protein DGG95_01930 [Cytophagales bacterium]|jgi:hypothetical protein|nr:hypothetical protein [Cytophagales bacterium]